MKKINAFSRTMRHAGKVGPAFRLPERPGFKRLTLGCFNHPLTIPAASPGESGARNTRVLVPIRRNARIACYERRTGVRPCSVSSS